MSFESSPLLSEVEKMPESEMNFDQLCKLYQKEGENGDELLAELCDDVIHCSHRYFSSVLRTEQAAQVQQFRMSPEGYRAHASRLDHDRRITHNALHDKLRILARASAKAGIKADWYLRIAGQHDNRRAVGEWALKNVFEEIANKETLDG